MKLSSLGVAPAKEKQFSKKNIFTVEDLVRYLPRRYNDFTKETGILPSDQVSCITAKVNRVLCNYGRIPTMTALCTITPTGEGLSVTWFNQNYLKRKMDLCVNQNVYVVGKLTWDEQYNNYKMTSPLLFEPNVSENKKIQPVYSKIPGMSNDYLTKKIKAACGMSGVVKETLPFELIGDLRLLSMREALYKSHFPQNMQQVEKAQMRLMFDDMVYFALRNEWTSRNAALESPFAVKEKGLVNKVTEGLPYELTADQKAAVYGMLTHISEGNRLNALIQGDVGCGKSIVAFLIMAAMVDGGYQAAIMAPTQVLAKQHYEDLKGLVEPYGYSVVYLGSELKKAERDAAKKAIASGEAQFIVGTHAVLGKDVEYHNLALTVADEEHKFGVAQRAALVEKAADGVHSITMSATPIPRSLAQVVYGNFVQLYTITTMPEGRKSVITGIAKSREDIYNFVKEQIDLGRQAYVVCPMIDKSDSEIMAGVKSVDEVSEEYRNALEPYGIRIATLTGKDKKADTEQTIADFKNGDIDILISTTVIEVGVNVPRATVMVISSADRFGLASLHQLRGRVGRGEYQSYCILESDSVKEKAIERLNVMCQTTNGFEIAEADLKHRGTGDLFGTKQSGDNKYMTLMLAYPNWYKIAQKAAKKMLDNDIKCPIVDRVLAEVGEN